MRATALAAAVHATSALLAACGLEERGPPPKTYVVRSGDTLYSIATRHGLDWRDVARWNGIGGDHRIVAGQVLVLQAGARGRADARPTAAGAAAAPAPPRRAAVPAAPPVERADDAPPRGTLPWTWPADGRVAGPVALPAGGVGLRIDGTRGQDVRAAAPGRVVYVGSGLRAYGQLVIVKHDEAFLTAYGHNDVPYVREGDAVAAGQRIAAMGLGPGNRPMLYFEIRFRGRPVDPLTLLPAR